MPCLEPDKNLSDEAKKVLKALEELKKATKIKISERTGLDTPLVSRKLRELAGKGAVVEKDNIFEITKDGAEAAKKL